MKLLNRSFFTLGLVVLWTLMCCHLHAQTRALPKPDDMQQQLSQKARQQKQMIKDQSEALIKEQLNPQETYKELRKKAKDNLKQRFDILKNTYQDSRPDTVSFKLPTPLKFNGFQASAMQQVAQRSGSYPLENPGDFRRFQMRGGVELFGLPLQTQALHSTEQAEDRQQMNQFSLSLDIQTLQTKIRQRIDNRIQQLENAYQTTQFQDLDKLYQFEQLKALDDFTPDEINRFLGDPLSFKDSLQTALAQYQNPDDWVQYGQSTLEAAAADSLERRKKKLKGQYEKQLRKKLEKDTTLRKSLGFAGLNEKALQDPAKIHTAQFSQQQLKSKLSDETKRQKKRWLKKKQQKEDSLLTHFAEKKQAQMSKLEDQVEAFTQQQEVSKDQLNDLFQKRDSLTQHAPDQLMAYENVQLLQSLKEGSNEQRFQALKAAGIISAPEWLLSKVQMINFGTSNPSISDFTSREARIDGIGLEIAHGPLRLAYYGSKNQRPDGRTPFQRTLRVYNAQWQVADSSYFAVTHLYGIDQLPVTPPTEAEIAAASDSLTDGLHGQNAIWSARFHWKWKAFYLESEWAHAITDRNVSSLIPNFREGNPQWLLRGSDSYGDLRIGRAGSVKLSYQLMHHLRLQAKWARISPGYHSFGTPFPRNDLQGGEIAIEQQLLNGKLSIQPFYGLWTDNLTGQRITTSRIKEQGIHLTLVSEGLPMVAIDYRNNVIQNNRLERVTNLNVNGSHQQNFGGTTFQTSITANLMRSHSRDEEDGVKRRDSQRYTLEQSANFEFPLSVSGQLAYTNQPEEQLGIVRNGQFIFYPDRALQRLQGKWLSGAGAISYLAWGTWQNTVNMEYGQNQNQTGIKFQLGWESTVKLLGALNCRFSVMKSSLISNNPEIAYEEIRANAGLEVNF